MKKLRAVADVPARPVGLYAVRCAGIGCAANTTIPKSIEFMGLHFCSHECAKRFETWFEDWATRTLGRK